MFYPQCNLSPSLAVFDIIKHKGANAPKLLYYAHIVLHFPQSERPQTTVTVQKYRGNVDAVFSLMR
jgi:hypothetical protein